MSVRVLIVDDEPLARRRIRRFLSEHADMQIIAECGDGESAVHTILRENPDLVFLDVQLPEFDGFAVIRHVGLEKMPATVFVTAYDRYALDAFDASAIDYLLKPVAQERFTRALDRARRRIGEKPKPETTAPLLELLSRMAARDEYAERLPVAANGRILFIKTTEIDWIEAEGNYARLHVGSRSYEIRETLTGVERKLNPRDFVRIHRSTIVNLHRVKEVHTWLNGYHAVLLENGQELRMSRYQSEAAKRLGLAG